MALNKNFLSRAEELIANHITSRDKILNDVKLSMGQFIQMARLNSIILINNERELAVFRMMEHALKEQSFGPGDSEEIVSLLELVRARSEQDLSALLSPEVIAELKKQQEEVIAGLDVTNVNHQTPQ